MGGRFRLLEPDAGKPARPVLRGEGCREVSFLPDFIQGFDSPHPLHFEVITNAVTISIVMTVPIEMTIPIAMTILI